MNLERFLAGFLGLTHGVQHFMRRLLPPLIPIFAGTLGYPLWQLGLLVSVGSLLDGVGQAPMGVLSDRYDRRFVIATGFGMMGAGYLLFSFAGPVGALLPIGGAFHFTNQFLVMLAAMFVVGLGSSTVHPTGYPLITDNVRPDFKGQALAVWNSASKFGDAAAPAMVGVLVVFLGWQGIVFGVGATGVVYAAVLFYVLGRPGVETAPISNRADEEAEADEDTSILADRRTYIYPIVLLFLFFAVRMVATSSVVTFVPQFILEAYNYSFSVEGVVFTEESTANFFYTGLLVAAGIGQLFLGWFSNRADPRYVILGCLLLGAAGLVSVTLLQVSPIGLVVLLVVIGVGLWGLNPARDMLVSEIAPPEREGRTFGYLWTSAKLVGALSPAVVGYLGDTVGLVTAFKYMAVFTLLSGVPIALLFSNRLYLSTTDGEPA